MNELKTIAEINEEIKGVVSVAENISLTATNAMLVARQAGNHAVGFSMVVRELRRYSEKTAEAMQGLSRLIYSQVLANANKRNQVRKLDLLNKAEAGGGLAQTRIAPACTSNQANVEETERLIATQVRDLQLSIRRTRKQCAAGLVIARSAGIEAAHGGEMMPILRQIAQDVEAIVVHIAQRIKKLESRLSETRA